MSDLDWDSMSDKEKRVFVNYTRMCARHVLRKLREANDPPIPNLRVNIPSMEQDFRMLNNMDVDFLNPDNGHSMRIIMESNEIIHSMSSEELRSRLNRPHPRTQVVRRRRAQDT